MDLHKISESDEKKFRQALANDPEIAAINREDTLTMCLNCTYWQIKDQRDDGFCCRHAPSTTADGNTVSPTTLYMDRCGDFKLTTTLRLEAAMERVKAEVLGRNFSEGA